MRRGAGLARNLARFVHDRHRAIAGLFGDRAVDDVDDGRTVGVAVPGYNAAWLNDELAQAQRAAVNRRWLLGQSIAERTISVTPLAGFATRFVASARFVCRALPGLSGSCK